MDRFAHPLALTHLLGRPESAHDRPLDGDHVDGRLDEVAGDEQIRDAARRPRPKLPAPSKYFRPLTVFCCSRAVNGPCLSMEAIRSAFIVELFHNVSLIIDDIVDHSRHRRGKLTLHCRFGTLRALMTAGYIVAEGYHLSQDDPQAVRLLSELLQRLGVAECLQWRLRQQPLGVEDWRRIAGEDTGSMFEVCAALGARDERLRRSVICWACSIMAAMTWAT
jgi:geranylgeranyl pyrophosphate synthase